MKTFETFKLRSPTDWPEDIGLAIPANMNTEDIPDRLIELYLRFYHLGWINELGNSCVFMSSLLRRIMRLHGIEAQMKQVILYWRNDKKGYHLLIGNPREDGEIEQSKIDLHMVVKSGDWLLDFAASPLHFTYGYTAPRAIIIPWTKDMEKHYVDLGIGGKASYVENTLSHPKLANWRYTQRQDVLDFSKKYFEKYAL